MLRQCVTEIAGSLVVISDVGGSGGFRLATMSR